MSRHAGVASVGRTSPASMPRRRGRGAGLVFLGAMALLFPMSAETQEPPDSTRTADSLVADSLQVADSTAADSLPPPPVLPRLRDARAPSGAPGVWEWGRTELEGRRGHTVWELMTEIPGVVPIRSGDYGSPATVFSAGQAGGGLRVFFDGIEHLPVEGSVPDLSRLPLSGLDAVRVVRRATHLEIHLDRYEHDDARPYSYIEAGTGDLSTNLLRGVFSLPRAVQGKLTVGLERVDTRGRGGSTPGAATLGWARYSIHHGDRAGLQAEVRNAATDRTDSLVVPASVTRRDWTIRGVWSPTEATLLSAWANSVSFSPKDSGDVLLSRDTDRRQFGLRASGQAGGFGMAATARLNQGDGLVEQEYTVDASWSHEDGHGVAVSAWQQSWDGESGTGVDGRAWISPLPVLQLFAEGGMGDRAVPFVPLRPSGSVLDSLLMRLEAVDPGPRFTHQESLRAGAEIAWRGLRLRGAFVRTEADSVWPTEMPWDRGGAALSLPARTGWEAEARLPLWPDGLAVQGGVNVWETADSMAYLYMPDHGYHGSLSFHNTYLPTGNFELWVDVGAQGRPEMTVPLSFNASATPLGTPEVAVVPFYQNWFFRLQMRIVSVNIFATVENLALRNFNQDVPGNLLPRTRSMYGVRWPLWN